MGMDRSEVRAIVERELGPLTARLGIAHWQLRVSYDPSTADDAGHLQHGECTRLVDYQSAHVSLNPESFDDAETVLRTLRHELFHVVLAPFDLFSSSVDRALAGSPVPAVAELLDRVWHHACEGAVINLERMYQRLSGPKLDTLHVASTPDE